MSLGAKYPAPAPRAMRGVFMVTSCPARVALSAVTCSNVSVCILSKLKKGIVRLKGVVYGPANDHPPTSCSVPYTTAAAPASMASFAQCENME